MGLQPYEPNQTAVQLKQFSESLTSYLESLQLPTVNVLVDMSERLRVFSNIEYTLANLNTGQRQAAMYISKFMAACSMGLFDAALNYLWDETIRNLRNKVAQFDLTYFYDSVITDPTYRSKFKDETDLDKLEDWRLIQGCRETGLITEIGYKHLDFIRDMRNHASAAHPNQNQITGLQLATWLETCILEVLSKEPEGLVTVVKKLLNSLRNETLVAADIPTIAAGIGTLTTDLSRSMLRSAFGMYTDIQIAVNIRDNLRLVAPELWAVCDDEARYECGLKWASFSANGEVSRANRAREFLEMVQGLTYLPLDSLALEISQVIDRLLAAHKAFDNFYNEYAHASSLQTLIPDNGEIPNAILGKYIQVLTMCKIGNGYGVARSAEPIYDDLIHRWQDQHVILFIRLLKQREVATRLQLSSCAANYQALSAQLYHKVANSNVKILLKYIIDADPGSLSTIAGDDPKIKQMMLAIGIR